MQPLNITIFGDFWDCQIYSGRLYLWNLDGELLVYNWRQIIDKIIKDESNRLAMSCAFLKSNYLYHHHEIFEDEEFKYLLLEKIKRLEKLKKTIHVTELSDFLIGHQDNPFKELPADTDIFINQLYATTDEGFWRATAHKKKGNPVSSRPIKLWDNRLLSINGGKYGNIALSGGSEGLFQYNENGYDSFDLDEHNVKQIEKNITQLSDKHSLFNAWNALSIYSSSDISESYLSIFEWDGDRRNKRKFTDSVTDSKIFKGLNLNGSLSWGAGDKIYKAEKNNIFFTRFDNYGKNGHYFSDPELIPLDDLDGEVIDAKVCIYGTVIECENSLMVIKSDNEIFKINEPVTRWRVYPRSKNYENHLHVILEDRIEIYSFNHDYFVNQSDKKIGMTHKMR